MEFLFIIVGSSGLDLSLDLSHAGSDCILLACTVHDSGVVLVDGHLLGCAKVSDRGLSKLHALEFADHVATGEDCDILEHLLASVTETGSLHGADLERAADTVRHESGKSLIVHILSDDEQRTAALSHSLENGKHILEVGDLLIVEKNVGRIHLALHLLAVGNEVGGDITAVELHAFHHIDRSLSAFGFLYSDYTLFLHLLHGFGDEAADLLVIVGGNAGNILDFLYIVVNLLALGLDTLYHAGNSLVDTALEVHRVGTGGNVLEAYIDDGLCEDGGGGCAVAGLVARLGGNLLHELGAHILERVLEFDFASHGNAILSDVGSAEFLFDDYIASFGTECHFDSVCQSVNAILEFFASLDIEFYLFCHFCQNILGG